MKHFFLLITCCLLLAPSFSQDSMNVRLLYQWKDTTLIPSWAHENTYNEIWGYAKNGKEYAIIGTTAGTHIFDVTDPVNSTQVVFIAGAVQGDQIVHRDYHDYADYLYIVADEGSSTLQIADLSFLPDSAPLVYDSDVIFSRSHNIFIDAATARLYTCGGNGNNGIRIFSLANPVNPVEIINMSMPAATHDVFARNDTAYINDGNQGLFIYDFSNIANPQLLGSLTNYPQQGYNHSGWLNAVGDKYIFADETHGMELKLLDVSDLGNMTITAFFGSGIVDTLSIPHNPIIKGDTAYVSYYHDGFYMFDISDPFNPFVAGFYGTSKEPNATNYRGSWGVYPFLPSGTVLVSDMQEGLFVFDVSNQPPEGEDEFTVGRSPFTVFPNPSDGIFEIRIQNSELRTQNSELKVLNVLGEEIDHQLINSSTHQLDLSNQPNDIYFLQITSDDFSVTKKLVKVE